MEYQGLAKELTELLLNGQKIQQLIGAFEAILKQTQQPLPPDKQESYNRVLLSKEANDSRLEASQNRQKEIESHLNRLEFVSLNVSDVIYPGVTISMGSNTILLKDEIKNATYRYIDKEIVQQIYSAQASRRA